MSGEDRAQVIARLLAVAEEQEARFLALAQEAEEEMRLLQQVDNDLAEEAEEEMRAFQICAARTASTRRTIEAIAADQLSDWPPDESPFRRLVRRFDALRRRSMQSNKEKTS